MDCLKKPCQSPVACNGFGYCRLFNKPHTAFVIQAIHDNESFWSNNLGWSDLKSATIFGYPDNLQMNLPLGGKWIPMDTV